MSAEGVQCGSDVLCVTVTYYGWLICDSGVLVLTGVFTVTVGCRSVTLSCSMWQWYVQCDWCVHCGSIAVSVTVVCSVWQWHALCDSGVFSMTRVLGVTVTCCSWQWCVECDWCTWCNGAMLSVTVMCSMWLVTVCSKAVLVAESVELWLHVREIVVQTYGQVKPMTYKIDTSRFLARCSTLLG